MLRQTGEQDAGYLPEVLPEIVSNYRSLGDLQGLRDFLEETSRSHPGAGAELPLADLIRETEDEIAASDYLAEQLVKSPSLALLLRSIEMNSRLPDSQSSQFVEGLRPHIRRLLDDKPSYQCTHCGYAAKTLHWQCPSCRRWSTIKRKSATELEP